jgi:hypothetical protein
VALDGRSAGLLALARQVAITGHAFGEPVQQLACGDPLRKGRAGTGFQAQAYRRQGRDHLLGVEVGEVADAVPLPFHHQVPRCPGTILIEPQIEAAILDVAQITDAGGGLTFDLGVGDLHRGAAHAATTVGAMRR